jgi:hypothetical protein
LCIIALAVKSVAQIKTLTNVRDLIFPLCRPPPVDLPRPSIHWSERSKIFYGGGDLHWICHVPPFLGPSAHKHVMAGDSPTEYTVWELKGIVSRDFVVWFLFSFDRSDISTHQEWVLLLLNVRFRIEFFDFRVWALWAPEGKWRLNLSNYGAHTQDFFIVYVDYYWRSC